MVDMDLPISTFFCWLPGGPKRININLEGIGTSVMSPIFLPSHSRIKATTYKQIDQKIEDKIKQNRYISQLLWHYFPQEMFWNIFATIRWAMSLILKIKNECSVSNGYANPVASCIFFHIWSCPKPSQTTEPLCLTLSQKSGFCLCNPLSTKKVKSPNCVSENLCIIRCQFSITDYN